MQLPLISHCAPTKCRCTAVKYRQTCGWMGPILRLPGSSSAHVTYNCARMYYSGAHDHPRGRGQRRGAPRHWTVREWDTTARPPESTSEFAAATANSQPARGAIDIEITRPRVTLHPPPLRVEVGRVGIAASRLASSGARLLVRPRRGKSLEVRAAHELRRTFALMGPTYVKLGQLIASSPASSPRRCPTSSAPCSTEFRRHHLN